MSVPKYHIYQLIGLLDTTHPYASFFHFLLENLNLLSFLP